MTPLFRRSRQQRLSAHRRAAGLLVAGMCALLGQYAAAQEQVTRLDVLREAWNVARTIPSLSQRASALADVGLALQPLDPAQGLEALNEAGFAAVSVPSQVEQALALQAVARRLEKVDAGRAEGLFRTAITSVEKIPYPAQRSLVYTEIALSRGATATETAAELMQKAAEQARAVPELGARVGALRDVSKAYERFDSAIAAELFDEAVTAAQQAPAGAERDLALAELAGAVAGRSVGQALQISSGIADPAAKSEALGDVVRAIASREPAQALELALGIPDVPTRIGALADLSLGAGPDTPEVARSAAEEATEAANALPEDDVGNEARASAAVARAPVEVTEALAAARQIADPYFGDVALSRIALFLVGSDLDRALLVTLEIEREVLQSEPLCAVVAGLAERDPQKAHELAAKIRARDRRVEALLTVALHLAA